MVSLQSGDHGERFSVVAGGPFHGFLRRLGLIGEDLLPTQGAAVGLTVLAWLLPALLVVLQSFVDSGYSGWGFFKDLTVYSRYLIAIGVMVATERYADGRLELLARQFRTAGLVTDDGLPAFRAALASADRYSSSTLAEVVLGAVALIWSGLSARFAVELAGSSWEGKAAANGVGLSWAGMAALLVSNPLFLFLTFRWIWRFLLWSALLFRVSRLPLELTPLHPDRSAGLGFLAIYPSIFGGFVFALSCVVASTMMKDLSLQQHSTQTVWFALGGWLVVCLVLFFGPSGGVQSHALRRAREGISRVRLPGQPATSRVPPNLDRGGKKWRRAPGPRRCLLGCGSERSSSRPCGARGLSLSTSWRWCSC